MFYLIQFKIQDRLALCGSIIYVAAKMSLHNTSVKRISGTNRKDNDKLYGIWGSRGGQY